MAGQLISRLLGFPSYRDKTTAIVLTAQQTIYRAIIVLLTVTAILWMAVFLYVAFYYSYMPAIQHTRPVHLQYESCGREQGLCTYPTANVTLTRRQQLLMVGQPYRILVELDMPESRRNQEVGMFMVCLELKDAEKVVMDSSCRSAMLHYKSPLLQSIMTTMFAPLFMSGSAEEKQAVGVELFSGFEEDPMRPVTEAMVKVKSQHVEVYTAALRIHAHFTGLRYFMFHWPVLSASVGVLTNLFFLSVIAFLSWYKFFTPKQVVVHVGYDSSAAKTLEERRALAKERLMRERSKLVTQKSEEKKDADGEKGKKGADDEKEKLEEPQCSPVPVATPSSSPPEKTEKEGEEKESAKPEKKDEVKSERRTSEEYEVLSGEGHETPKVVKVKGEDEDDDDFSELDPDSEKTNGRSSKDGDSAVEEDKENIPKKKDDGEDDNSASELRKRKVKTKSEDDESVA